MKSFKVLALGDVVGQPGRAACLEIIPRLRQEHDIDLVIVNVENIAGGSGITENAVNPLFEAGVDIMTSGDHVFKKKEAEVLLEENHAILKPANYPPQTPGHGTAILEAKSGIKVGVINLLGRVFLQNVDCPFQTARREIEKMKQSASIILVDFHAEATSEKVAMGWFLDGQVSAVFGTHTHVQTADDQILPCGTGYITDIGMCGAHYSVIGRRIENVLKMFLTQMPGKLEVATEDARISGVLFEIDPQTKKTISIQRIHEKVALEAVRN